jgi:peptidoglycan/LPS O-acetylase OafA/YrhL
MDDETPSNPHRAFRRETGVAHPASGGRIIRDIEVLRALAVLSTIFQHRIVLLTQETRTHVLDPYFQWWGGVDIFFVVSGFVISRGLLAARRRYPDNGAFLVEIGAFWIRRIWRIWPTAWFWVAVSLTLSIVVHSIWGPVLPNLASTAAILASVENLHQYYTQAVPTMRGSMPFAPYWSLSLEEQFYLLLPVLLLLVRYRRLALVCALGAAVQIVIPRPIWSLLWSIRSDALLIGVLIGLSMEHPRLRSLAEPVFLRRPAALRYASTGLLLFLISVLAADHIVPICTGLIAILAGLLVWFASYDAGYILPEGPAKRVLVWLGARSYAIYLIHIPTFYFTLEFWHHITPPGTPIDGRFTLRLVLTAIPLLLLLAEANYRLLEQPLRRKGAALSRGWRLRHQAERAGAQPGLA